MIKTTSATTPTSPQQLRLTLAGQALEVALHTQGQGAPLVLVHSINAAAGVHEVQPLLQDMAASHAVYAPDLPGFGASSRPDIAYSPRLFTDSLHTVVAPARQRHGGAPVAALALSLGCEFLARAAAERPGDYSHIALVSPTGLMGEVPRRGPRGATREVPLVHSLLTKPGWGGPLFRSLTKPGVVRYFLRRTWGGEHIDEAMWAEAVAAARAPGAEHAPLRFLSGGLFSRDALALYESLTMPVWASHGTRGDFTDYRGKRFLEGRANWRWTVYDGGAIPYFEHRAAFVASFARFLARA
jgi:pimeloyl-ACP methyl ester carboxylesterase